jgi:hypothetical protein
MLSTAQITEATHSKNAWASYIASLALAAIVLMSSFLITIEYPIYNEKGLPASPLHAAPSSDLVFYQQEGEAYRLGGWQKIWLSFTKSYQREKAYSGGIGHMVTPHQLAPPIFPLLVSFFDYNEHNTLPLAVIYLFLGFAFMAIWLTILRRKGVSGIWLLGFSLLPHTVWFTINLGSDLILALIFAGFYFFFKPEENLERAIITGLGFSVLALLTRATGVSLLAYVVLYITFMTWSQLKNQSIFVFLAIGAVSITAATIFFPYLLEVVHKSSEWPFFGIQQKIYMSGLFPELPTVINTTLSWAALIGAKLLYAIGLRPSYGETSWILVLIRSAPGLIFAPGIIYLFVAGKKSDRLLVAMVMLPILIGPAQDRYTLPIQPLLFLYAWKAWQQVRIRFKNIIRVRQ